MSSIGFSEDQAPAVDTAQSSSTVEDSLAEADECPDEGIENKLTCHTDESEDSRFIPDIDDHSEDPDEVESAISLVLLEEVPTTTHDVEYNATAGTEISAGQIEALINFSTLLKTEGIEILKLNRRGKWQTRFLTVSSEVLHLQNSGDLSQYPQALLWVKRFNPNQSHSLHSISSEGRGGVEFTNIESAIFDESENHAPKYNGKFKESVQLNLHYTCGENSRTLALRFKTKRDADYFAASMETIVDVLDHEGIY